MLLTRSVSSFVISLFGIICFVHLRLLAIPWDGFKNKSMLSFDNVSSAKRVGFAAPDENFCSLP